ncbi:MAG TPA: uL15 family ribosomal protein [Candidatus Paceibacterota bacterium]|nr:uL15 family ribosomal protein [Candidatus Paceibacterota bacterium]
MQLHQVKPIHSQKAKKRVGRGGKRGTYSGKGLKGQLARAGRKLRPEIRDFIKKIPKKRGYRFKSFTTKPQIFNLKDLEKKYNNGEIVSPETLLEKRLIVKINNKVPDVKILGDGKLKKKLKVENCRMSKSAEKICNG